MRDRAQYFRAFAAGPGREVGSESCVGRRLVLVFLPRTAGMVVVDGHVRISDLYGDWRPYSARSKRVSAGTIGTPLS